MDDCGRWFLDAVLWPSNTFFFLYPFAGLPLVWARFVRGVEWPNEFSIFRILFRQTDKIDITARGRVSFAMHRIAHPNFIFSLSLLSATSPSLPKNRLSFLWPAQRKNGKDARTCCPSKVSTKTIQR
jgi:hypothetical protein